MLNFVYDKLVRSDVVDKMREKGVIVHTVTLSADEYRRELGKKLLEEANEVVEAKDNETELLDEVSDVYEVILAICDSLSIGVDDLKKIGEKKRLERGSFIGAKKIDYISMPTVGVDPFVDDYIAYLRQNGDRYREF